MAGKGGKSKAAKNRAKKRGRPARIEAQQNKTASTTRQPDTLNSMPPGDVPTEEELLAADYDMENATLYSDSLSDLTDSGFPSSPPVSSYNPYERWPKNEYPNIPQGDLVSFDFAGAEMATNVTGTASKVDQETGTIVPSEPAVFNQHAAVDNDNQVQLGRVSAYPSLSQKYAVEHFGSMDPPPRVASLEPKSKTKHVNKPSSAVNNTEAESNANMELLKNHLMSSPGARPLPITPTSGANAYSRSVSKTEAGKELDNHFDNALSGGGPSAVLNAMKMIGDIEINQYAEAKAREMEESQLSEDQEYNPELLDTQIFKQEVQSDTTFFAKQNQLKAGIKGPQMTIAWPKTKMSHAISSTETSGSKPESPQNVVVQSLNKGTVTVVLDQSVEAATNHGISATPAAPGTENKEISYLFNLTSDTAFRDKDKSSDSAVDPHQMHVLRSMVTTVLTAHEKGTLPKQDSSRVPLEQLTEEDMETLKARAPKDSSFAALKDSSNSKGKIPIKLATATWLNEDIRDKIQDAVKSPEKSYTTKGGDTLVAVNDEPLIDLNDAEVPKTKSKKKKSGNKKKKPKKAILEDASKYAPDLEAPYKLTDGDYEVRPNQGQILAARLMNDTAVNIVSTSKSNKRPQTLGQMREEEKIATGNKEFLEKCVSAIGEKDFESLINMPTFTEETLRDAAARNLAGPAAALDANKLRSIIKEANQDDIDAFCSANHLFEQFQDANMKGKIRDLIGGMNLNPKDINNLEKLMLDAKETATKSKLPSTGDDDILMEGVRTGPNERDVEDLVDQPAKPKLHAIHRIHDIMRNGSKADLVDETEIYQLVSLMQGKLTELEKAVETAVDAVEHLTRRNGDTSDLLRVQRGKLADAELNARSHNTRLMALEEAQRLRPNVSAATNREGLDTGAAVVRAASHIDSQQRSFDFEFGNIKEWVSDKYSVLETAIKELDIYTKLRLKESDAKVPMVTDLFNGFQSQCLVTSGDITALQAELALLKKRISDYDVRIRKIEAAIKGPKPNDVSFGLNGSSPETIVKAEKDILDVASKVGSIVRDLNELATKVNGDMAKHTQTVGAIRGELAGLQKTTKATKMEVASIESTIAAQAVQIDALEQSSERADGGLREIGKLQTSQSAKLATTNKSINRVIAEQNTIRNAVRDLENYGITKTDIVVTIQQLEKRSDDSIDRVGKLIDNNAIKTGECYGLLDDRCKKLSAELQKQGRDMSGVAGRFDKAQKQTASDRAQTQSNTRRLDLTNSQLNKLWAKIETELGPVDDDGYSHISTNGDDGVDEAKTTPQEGLTQAVPQKKKKRQQQKGTATSVKTKVDQKDANTAVAPVNATAQTATDTKSETLSRPMLVHAASQTDRPETIQPPVASTAVPTTPSSEQPADIRLPKVRIPKIGAVVSESLASAGAPSPAPMMPHPTPPGSATARVTMQSQPPPIMTLPPLEPSSDEPGHLQQGPPSGISQPVFVSPGMAMDRAMQAPPGFYAPSAVANAPQTPMLGGNEPPPGLIMPGHAILPPQDFRIPSGFAAPPGFDAAHLTPPPGFHANMAQAQGFNQMMANDLWALHGRMHEVDNTLSFFQGQHRQLRMDLRYEIGTAEAGVERRVNEKIDRVAVEVRDRMKRIEERQRETQGVLGEVLRRLGMSAPKGFGK